MNSEKSVQVDSLINSTVDGTVDGTVEVTNGDGSNGDRTHNSTPTHKCIRLPEPDVENITVLTRQLPNDPILPWHHYDSPWLEPNPEEVDEEQPQEIAPTLAEEDAQLEADTDAPQDSTPEDSAEAA